MCEIGVETVGAVGAPSGADGSFGAWLRPWRIVSLGQDRVGVYDSYASTVG